MKSDICVSALVRVGDLQGMRSVQTLPSSNKHNTRHLTDFQTKLIFMLRLCANSKFCMEPHCNSNSNSSYRNNFSDYAFCLEFEKHLFRSHSWFCPASWGGKCQLSPPQPNDSISTSDYTVTNADMISQQWIVKNVLKAAVAWLQALCHYSWCPNWDSNRSLPEYKSVTYIREVLSLNPGSGNGYSDWRS